MDTLREELGVEATIKRGARGVFSVEVDGVVVAQKTPDGFPDDVEIVNAVDRALNGTRATR